MLEILLQKFGKPMVTLAEAAHYMQMDPRTLLKDGTFPITVQRGKKDRYYVKVAALARWLEK